MAKYTIIRSGGCIIKDGAPVTEADVSWLPEDILAVHAAADGSGELERGDFATETTTANENFADCTAFDWWSNVDTAWQTRYDEDYAPPPEGE